MKIAIISTPYIESPPKNYGGLELVTFNIAKGLAKRGHDITLIAPEGSTSDGFRLFTTGIPTGMQVNWLETEREHSLKYKELIETENFDVILDSTWFSLVYGFKKQNPKQKIAHVHHGHMSYNPNFATNHPDWYQYPSWVHYVTSITPTPNLIAISNWMKRMYLAQFKIFSRVAYNGIDTDIYKYDPNAEVTNRLLFVGRIDELKRPDIAIEVAEKAGLPLDILGSVNWSAHKDYAERQIERVKKIGNVYLEADTSAKVKLMQQAKAVLVPSTFGEPFGLVVAEALACGTPVIAIDDGGINEMLYPHLPIAMRIGVLCDIPTDMIEAVKNLDSSDYDRTSNACYIKENFSLDVMAERYENLLNQVVAGKEW